jgi:hypothetical protein
MQRGKKVDRPLQVRAGSGGPLGKGEEGAQSMMAENLMASR